MLQPRKSLSGHDGQAPLFFVFSCTCIQQQLHGLVGHWPGELICLIIRHQWDLSVVLLVSRMTFEHSGCGNLVLEEVPCIFRLALAFWRGLSFDCLNTWNDILRITWIQDVLVTAALRLIGSLNIWNWCPEGVLGSSLAPPGGALGPWGGIPKCHQLLWKCVFQVLVKFGPQDQSFDFCSKNAISTFR